MGEHRKPQLRILGSWAVAVGAGGGVTEPTAVAGGAVAAGIEYQAGGRPRTIPEPAFGVAGEVRKARGIALTAAGRVFLDHARLASKQIEVACEAARGTERPEKPGFVVGFLLGQEAIWLAKTSNPNFDSAPHWPAATMKSAEYFEIGAHIGSAFVLFSERILRLATVTKRVVASAKGS